MPAHNGSSEPGPAAGPGPAFVIVGGNPAAEEIAAVVAVLAARAAPAAGPARAGETIRSDWSARSRLLRAPLPRGPGGWRASALPR